MMKVQNRLFRSVCMVLACLMLLVSVPAYQKVHAEEPTAATTKSFTDIEDHWAKNEILWAAENGIADGMAEGLFEPNTTLTRAMFVTFLYRTAKLMGERVTTPTVDCPFSDVDVYEWYYQPLLWAYENGVLNGKGTTGDLVNGAPNENITRQETATMLSRFIENFYETTIPENNKIAFTDAAKIADWAKNAAKATQALGIFRGYPDNSFGPDDLANRASAVTVFRRLYQVLVPQNQLTDQEGKAYDGVNLARRFMLSDSMDETLTQTAEDTTALFGAKSFSYSRIEITATLGETGKLLLVSPDAQDENLKELDLAAYTESDSKEHTYTLFFLENNTYLFFVDGREVHRIGNEYVKADTEAAPATLQVKGEASVTSVKRFGAVDDSPYTRHGKLHTFQQYIYDESGYQYQIGGMHLFLESPQYRNYVNYATMKWLRDDWGIDCIRIGLVLNTANGGTNGYLVSPQEDRQLMYNMLLDTVEWGRELGLYIIIDWHGLDEQTDTMERADPNIYKEEAKTFFEDMSSRYQDDGNVLYELYNEPLSGSGWQNSGFTSNELYAWDRIKTYANEVIPIIRKNSPNSMILVGTPTACQKPDVAAADPLDYPNIVYTMHFYAGMHGEAVFSKTVNAMFRFKQPVLISEFGIENGTLMGDSPNALDWWMQGIQKRKIGNINFILLPGIHLSADISWDKHAEWDVETELTDYGRYMRNWYRSCNLAGN